MYKKVGLQCGYSKSSYVKGGDQSGYFSFWKIYVLSLTKTLGFRRVPDSPVSPYSPESPEYATITKITRFWMVEGITDLL